MRVAQNPHARSRNPGIAALSVALALAGCADNPIAAPETEGLLFERTASSVSDARPSDESRAELAAARAGTARYHRLENAIADGFVDIDVFVPGMGHHFLDPARLDATFDARRPEILVYSPGPNGRMRLVAVEYAVPFALSAEAPEGFTGTEDTWERNETFQLWVLHAWIWMHNPDGMFAGLNPRLDS